MGQIGRFIDYAVSHNPELMARVHDRPWGTLARFVTTDDDGARCGCLVGSIALEAGLKDGDGLCGAVQAVRSTMGTGCPDIAQAGYAVWCALAAHLMGADRWWFDPSTIDDVPQARRDAAEMRAIMLLKGRIARRLRERNASPVAQAEYCIHDPLHD